MPRAADASEGQVTPARLLKALLTVGPPTGDAAEDARRVAASDAILRWCLQVARERQGGDPLLGREGAGRLAERLSRKGPVALRERTEECALRYAHRALRNEQTNAWRELNPEPARRAAAERRMRREAKRRGVPYEQVVREWSAKKDHGAARKARLARRAKARARPSCDEGRELFERYIAARLSERDRELLELVRVHGPARAPEVAATVELGDGAAAAPLKRGRERARRAIARASGRGGCSPSSCGGIGGRKPGPTRTHPRSAPGRSMSIS